MRAYRAALEPSIVVARPSPAAPTSFRWLVERYYASALYSKLSDSTRRVRRGILETFCISHGSKPFARLERKHVIQFRDEKAATPEAANATIPRASTLGQSRKCTSSKLGTRSARRRVSHWQFFFTPAAGVRMQFGSVDRWNGTVSCFSARRRGGSGP
jgi:hypothetical protein